MSNIEMETYNLQQKQAHADKNGPLRDLIVQTVIVYIIYLR